MNYNVKIVIIDDELKHLHVFIDNLVSEYGEDNILRYDKAKEGLDYILENKGLQKMVLILDYSLAIGDLSCVEVFEAVVNATSLVSIIIMTHNDLEHIGVQNLEIFVNKHAYYLLADQHKRKLQEKIQIVRQAVENMGKRVDTAMEEWILRHNAQERDIPYIITKEGKTYSLNNLLQVIRKQEKEGIELERKILSLAIDLLARKKEHI